MKIILIIKPQFTNLIFSGHKTVEMRTKIGKEFVDGADIVIYSSSPVKAIVGLAKIDKIQYLQKKDILDEHLKSVCISKSFFDQYMEKREKCYLIHLRDVKKITHAISLKELKNIGFTAPQSFCYTSKEVIKLIKANL